MLLDHAGAVARSAVSLASVNRASTSIVIPPDPELIGIRQKRRTYAISEKRRAAIRQRDWRKTTPTPCSRTVAAELRNAAPWDTGRR